MARGNKVTKELKNDRGAYRRKGTRVGQRERKAVKIQAKKGGSKTEAPNLFLKIRGDKARAD